MMPFLNVLSISADEQVHKIAKMQLDSLGHTITSAYTAEESIECAYSLKPDIVLLDLALGGDVLLALDILREWTATTPNPLYVIAITAPDDTEIRQHILDGAVDDVLSAPITPWQINTRFHIAARHLHLLQSLHNDYTSLTTKFNRIHSMYEHSNAGLFRVDISSGRVTEANATATRLVSSILPALHGASLAQIIGDNATAEYVIDYITENRHINDYELVISNENSNKQWLSFSGYYNAGNHSIECVLFDITHSKNIASDREDLLVRLFRQRHELQEKNDLLTQAHKEIQLQHTRLSEQAMHIEKSNAKLACNMIQLQHMNTELAEKKAELEMTVKRLGDTQTQLVHSERMNVIGTMTAGVMHEINNPNGACYAALQDAAQGLNMFRHTLLAMIPPEEHESTAAKKLQSKLDDVVSVLHIATASSERISHIVNTLRNFSGFQRAEVQKASIIDIIDSAAHLFRYKYAGVSVSIQAEQKVLDVSGNIGELNQVFLNILTNAVQANATDIRITLGQKSGMLCIDIEDNGKGIPADVAASIFNPFFTTKSGDHSGIGLSISKNIVKSHGGRILVESEPGFYTRFKISLPLADTLAQGSLSHHGT